MIIASRTSEWIIINDEIEITVVEINGDQVRLGINAPKHIKIFRKEIYQEIIKENQSAANFKIKKLNLQDFIKPKE